MISLFLKSSVAFLISFLVLSFKFQNRPLFYHLSEITGPVGEEVQRSLGKSVERSISKSKGIFNNAEPKYLDDTINSQQSSLNAKNSKELILEEIKRDEARKLDELIKNN